MGLQRVGHSLAHGTLPLQGAWVESLVRKLKFYMPRSLNKYLNKR